jgi:ABC-type nickel/cobalt efflux system permease component RcnA
MITEDRIQQMIDQAIQKHESEVTWKGFFMATALTLGIFHAIWLLKRSLY